MPNYSFKDQITLFKIAIDIIEDYKFSSWSFGGGTALSSVYYDHRMSFDIDIFTDDFSSINTLLENKKEIANNLNITLSDIKASPSGITFILSQEEHQLKLDFLYTRNLTKNPLIIKNIFEQFDIHVQTPLEIISKKLKFRETLTIRDFVDIAYAERIDKILTSIKESNIIDLERFIDILDQFNSITDIDFNRELRFLKPIFMKQKKCIEYELFNALTPNDFISVAFNEEYDILSIDSWIYENKDGYESVGQYFIYKEIPKVFFSDLLNKDESKITYKDIYDLPYALVKKVESEFTKI